MKKWGFLDQNQSEFSFLGLEIKFFKLLSKKMRFLRSKLVRIQFFFKKKQKISKKKLP